MQAETGIEVVWAIPVRMANSTKGGFRSFTAPHMNRNGVGQAPLHCTCANGNLQNAPHAKVDFDAQT